MPRRSWLLRILLVFVLLAAALAVAHQRILTWLMQRQAMQALQGLGFPEARLHVARASLWDAEVESVALDATGGLRVGHVQAAYTPDALLAERVDRVVIRDAVLCLTVKDGRIDWGPLAQLRLSGGGVLPFQHLELRTSELVFDLGSHSLCVPVWGWIKHEKGQCRFEMQAAWQGLTALIQGTGDVQRQSLDQLTVEMQGLSGEALAHLAKALGVTQSVPVTGALEATLSAQYVDGKLQAQARLSGDELQVLAKAGGKPLAATLKGVHVDLALDESEAGLVLAKAGMESATLSTNGVELALGAFAAQARVAQDGEVSGGGEFEQGRVRYGNLPLPLATTKVQFSGRRIEFATAGTLLSRARFHAKGWLLWDGSSLAGALKSRVSRFTLRDDPELATLHPRLKACKITGDVALDGVVRLQDEVVKPNLRLRLYGVTLQARQDAYGVKGVTGTLQINGFDPLSTAPDQRLTIEHLEAGGLHAEDAEVVFHLEGPDSLRIAEAACTWAGGRLRTRDAYVHPLTGAADLVIDVETLSLQALLDVIYPGRVKGEGRLYGRLPVSIHLGQKMPLTLGAGFLEARPAKGWLQLTQEDAQILLGIDQVKPLAQATMNEMAKLMAMQALQDFAYDALAFRFYHDPEKGAVAQIQTRGMGPRKANPIPIGGLTITDEDVDVLLNLLIFYFDPRQWQVTRKKREAVREKQEAERNAIDQFF